MHIRAEELLRFLAGAAVAVRLYPESSPLRESALTAFARTSKEITRDAGPVPYVIDPERFIFAGTPVGESFPQVGTLCRSLHALQVGQLIIAPGVTAAETRAFLDVLGAEALTVREAGGVRDALVRAGVGNIAVIEVTLRAAEGEGIARLDLTAAECADIAAELPGLAETWQRSVATAEPIDELGAVIDALEPAARDLAFSRVAEALLLLDEKTRLRVLSAALSTDTSGAPMRGMLDAVAKLSPAALSRLLRLVADAAATTPGELLATLTLPADVAREVARLFELPTPEQHAALGYEPQTAPEPQAIASAMAATQESDYAHIIEIVRAARRESVAKRILLTTVRLAAVRPSAETIQALGEALNAAVANDAWDAVSQAIEAIDEAMANPTIEPEAVRVRAALAGMLVERYTHAGHDTRNELRRLLSALPENAGAAVAKTIRRDPDASVKMISLLLSLHDARVLPTVVLAVEQLDAQMAQQALVTIADADDAEAQSLLVRFVRTGDSIIKTMAVREIGRSSLDSAIPALIEALGTAGRGQKSLDLEQEILRTLELLHAEAALPAIDTIARRRFALGRHARQLRTSARTAAATIRQDR